MGAKYWIAQHIEDLFRNEPKNIGVFVQVDNKMAAKFIGEIYNNEIDGRKIKSLSYPDVYRQWIEYWRKLTETNSTGELIKTSGSHYRVIEAGQVSDIDSDSPEDIAQFLYSILVSEGGYKEAVSDEVENERPFISLENELTKIFSSYNLLNGSVRHPIEKNRQVEGEKVIHKPSFVQENGTLYIMETVDFTTTQKSRSRDHAGYSAYMFNDIKHKKPNTEAISIIKVRDQDKEIEDVRNGLIILNNESNVIDWSNEDEKKTFLENCRAVALS